MSFHLGMFTRKLHRWGAIITAVPMMLVIVTGLLLQIKKQSDWIQPPTAKGELANEMPNVEWNQIMESVSAEKYGNARIEKWSDIDRLDVRPSKGIVKVRAKSRWEFQVDLETGEVLQHEYRRTDFIESLHDGSVFGDFSKLVIFLGNGLILLGLWMTGMYLWYLPVGARRKKRKSKSAAKAT